MKKLLAVVTALVLVAAPATAQTTREVRPFIEYATEVMPRLTEVETYIGLEDYESAMVGLQDLTIWMLEKDPEPCYVGLWGVVIGFAAASAQGTAILLHAPGNLDLLIENNDFLARVKAVQDVIVSGPTLDC